MPTEQQQRPGGGSVIIGIIIVFLLAMYFGSETRIIPDATPAQGAPASQATPTTEVETIYVTATRDANQTQASSVRPTAVAPRANPVAPRSNPAPRSNAAAAPQAQPIATVVRQPIPELCFQTACIEDDSGNWIPIATQVPLLDPNTPLTDGSNAPSDNAPVEYPGTDGKTDEERQRAEECARYSCVNGRVIPDYQENPTSVPPPPDTHPNEVAPNANTDLAPTQSAPPPADNLPRRGDCRTGPTECMSSNL